MTRAGNSTLVRVLWSMSEGSGVRGLGLWGALYRGCVVIERWFRVSGWMPGRERYMYTHVYIYIHMYYIYIYMNIYIYEYIYMNIYIYTEREREREMDRETKIQIESPRLGLSRCTVAAGVSAVARQHPSKPHSRREPCTTRPLFLTLTTRPSFCEPLTLRPVCRGP